MTQNASADRHRLLQGWRAVRVAVCVPWQLLQWRRLWRVWRLLLLLLPCWQLRPRLLRGSKPCGLDGLHGVGRRPGHAGWKARSRSRRAWSKSDRTQSSVRSSTLCSASLLSMCCATQTAAQGDGIHLSLSVSDESDRLLISPRFRISACTRNAAL